MMKEKIINRVRESVPFLMLIALIILFALTTSGRFFTQYNLKLLLIQSSLYIVGGVGATFVMAHGNLDFSLGGDSCVICGDRMHSRNEVSDIDIASVSGSRHSMQPGGRSDTYVCQNSLFCSGI